MEKEVEDYMAERNEVLRSLDVDKFNAFWRKHDLPVPTWGWADPDIVPLIMMHKCRLQVASMTEAEKEQSREWLTSHGYGLGL